MVKKPKTLLFSVTRKDCDWKYTKGSGPGGQKKNKTSSACLCIHRESGARGYSEETRSQTKNRQIAFKKMALTKVFKTWHKIESAKRSGEFIDIEKEVDKEMKKIKVEIRENGIWVPDKDVL